MAEMKAEDVLRIVALAGFCDNFDQFRQNLYVEIGKIGTPAREADGEAGPERPLDDALLRQQPARAASVGIPYPSAPAPSAPSSGFTEAALKAAERAYMEFPSDQPEECTMARSIRRAVAAYERTRESSEEEVRAVNDIVETQCRHSCWSKETFHQKLLLAARGQRLKEIER